MPALHGCSGRQASQVGGAGLRLTFSASQNTVKLTVEKEWRGIVGARAWRVSGEGWL